MKVSYDEYYQTEHLFGEPYPELIDFFTKEIKSKKVLDLGCGQGRDAIALAKLGFDVTGIDISKVGIDQMNVIATSNNLSLKGFIADIFLFDDFEKYDIVLLNSMFHFSKNDKE
ncbi:MAG: class I SAM-dependent methyltransferase, partial [Saprospiraceae bacterium]